MPRQEVNTHHGRIGQVRDPVNPPGSGGRRAYVHGKFGDVRSGSKADVTLLNFHVRLPPKADIRSRDQDVCFGPKGDICDAAIASLFDHHVGAAK
jgi:hypothetical protein